MTGIPCSIDLQSRKPKQSFGIKTVGFCVSNQTDCISVVLSVFLGREWIDLNGCKYYFVNGNEVEPTLLCSCDSPSCA
ncbi:hypothetical protein LEP1GSC108_1218 [Leptospira weilii str. UI 13098]|uniref:Uncharacterized protein n=1 Tax=Leptospira weilii str. UI 13098 TaxID=1088542 RepID=M6QN10_9LEPT|nr:hypothetical protein LEP1GSC108_1218 [Leptospira weilii str. UI 13098]